VTTAILAEDEPLLREELRQLLGQLWPELQVLAEAEDGLEALQALESHRPQVLFLDIQMPGLSGLDVARAASGRCHVVFVTAYERYAVDAFEQGAVDYLLKPFSPARLASAIARVKERLHSMPAQLDGLLRTLAEGAPKRSHLRWINAAQGRDVRLVTTEEICYFRSSSKYTELVTAEGATLIRRTIRELLAELDPEVFWPIHRGVVVNANAIAAVHRKLNGQLEVRLKARPETLPVSEAFAWRFRQM
jgi:DNA-binding LytR/AlgR family response regulator